MKKIFFMVLAIFCALNVFAKESDVFLFVETDMETTQKVMEHFEGKKITEEDLEDIKTKTEKRVFPKYRYDANSGENILESAYVVENDNILDSLMILSIEFSEDMFGYNTINFNFNSLGEACLYEYTANNIGKYVAIIVNGKVLFNACVKQAIAGGKLELSGINSKKEMKEFYDGVKEIVDDIAIPDYFFEGKSMKDDAESFKIFHLDYDKSIELSSQYRHMMEMGAAEELIQTLLKAFAGDVEYVCKGDVVYAYDDECILTRENFKKVYVVETIPQFYGIIVTLNEEGQAKWKDSLTEVANDKYKFFLMKYGNAGFLIDAANNYRDDEFLIDYMFNDLAEFLASEIRAAMEK